MFNDTKPLYEPMAACVSFLYSFLYDGSHMSLLKSCPVLKPKEAHQLILLGVHLCVHLCVHLYAGVCVCVCLSLCVF